MNNKLKKTLIYILFFFFCLVFSPVKTYAVDTVATEEQLEEALKRKNLPVETNEIKGWPDGPKIGAQSAVLIDVETGTILYNKSSHDELFPASTTKLLTGLLVIENCAMDEVVTFSKDAIYKIDRDSTHLAIDVGEQITVKDCLYGLLLGSANEVAYALAEHEAGSLEAFVAQMNERAAALGCKNTHFNNSSGLPDDNHYTSAYDLALIARECFKNETFCTIAKTVSYTMAATNKNTERKIVNHHKMLPGMKYEYDGFLGGKTGYTKVARQTLVSCAERGGIRLVCVIMKEESPAQFTDTIELFDYGFSSFEKLNVSEKENRFVINSNSLYKTKYDYLGSSNPLVQISNGYSLIVPKSMDIEQLKVNLEYVHDGKNIARLDYFVENNPVGEAYIELKDTDEKPSEFSDILKNNNSEVKETFVPEVKPYFVNVSALVKALFIILVIIFLASFTVDLIRAYIVSKRRKNRLMRTRYKKRSENKWHLFKKRRDD